MIGVAFLAIKELPEATSSVTPLLRSELTAEESPPAPPTPQVTTEPSDFKAEKADKLLTTLTTPLLNSEATAVESPPEFACPQVTNEPSDFNAA